MSKLRNIKWTRVVFWVIAAVVLWPGAAAWAGDPGEVPAIKQYNPRNISVQIGSEKETYNSEYLLDALGLLEKCERFLKIRKEEVPCAAADAETSFKKLEKEHSKFGGSFLNKYMSMLLDRIGQTRDNVNFVDYQSQKAEQYKDFDSAIYKVQEIAVLSQEMELLISGIKAGLLLPGGGLKLTLSLIVDQLI